MPLRIDVNSVNSTTTTTTTFGLNVLNSFRGWDPAPDFAEDPKFLRVSKYLDHTTRIKLETPLFHSLGHESIFLIYLFLTCKAICFNCFFLHLLSYNKKAM